MTDDGFYGDDAPGFDEVYINASSDFEQDAEVVTTESATDIERQSPPKENSDEEEIVNPRCIRNRCDIPCQTMYIDGEYVPLCDIRKKYTFHLSDFQSEEDGMPRDGFVITNWWSPENTNPMWSQTRSSDMDAGAFIVYNGRIILADKGSVPFGYLSLPPYRQPRIQTNELTTTQWDELGIQIFEYGGDVTLISLCGVLSQMPELVNDNFHFTLYVLDSPSHEHEVQYILYHELPYSSLWSLLMG